LGGGVTLADLLLKAIFTNALNFSAVLCQFCSIAEFFPFGLIVALDFLRFVLQQGLWGWGLGSTPGPKGIKVEGMGRRRGE
jgi:hypothetical protein